MRSWSGRASPRPSGTDICYFDGFRADRLYELVYTAKNPLVMGLGYAAVRDVGSFLRFEDRDSTGTPNPLAQPGGGSPSPTTAVMRRMYATGAAQTGAFLRDFIYLPEKVHRNEPEWLPPIYMDERELYNKKNSLSQKPKT